VHRRQTPLKKGNINGFNGIYLAEFRKGIKSAMKKEMGRREHFIINDIIYLTNQQQFL
jgi:hypothetical protein